MVEWNRIDKKGEQLESLPSRVPLVGIDIPGPCLDLADRYIFKALVVIVIKFEN